MSWKDIIKDAKISGSSLDLGDRELNTDNLRIEIEMKEVSGSYRRKPSSYGGDRVSDKHAPISGFTEFGEYEFAFLPKLTGYAEIIDDAGTMEKIKAEDIEVYFEGGSFKNIKTFPVPISFKVELDFDEVPIVYITMEVA